jgi:DNA-binding NtrC family response regulator
MKTDYMPRRLGVLILDDDEDLAEVMREILLLRGHAVSIAYEFRTAWCEIARNVPDVFVVDFWIGPQSSTRLLAAVRLVFIEVRCILVSGSPSGEWAILLEQQLVQDALRKPFDAHDLVALVEGPRRGA